MVKRDAGREEIKDKMLTIHGKVGSPLNIPVHLGEGWVPGGGQIGKARKKLEREMGSV